MKLKAVDSRYTPWVDRIRATASLRERAGLVPLAREQRGIPRVEEVEQAGGGATKTGDDGGRRETGRVRCGVEEERARTRYSRFSGEKTRKTEEEGGTGRKEGGRENAKKGGKKEKMGKWSRRVVGRGRDRPKEERERWRSDEEGVEESTEEYYGASNGKEIREKKKQRRRKKKRKGGIRWDGGGGSGGGQRNGGWKEGEEEGIGIWRDGESRNQGRKRG